MGPLKVTAYNAAAGARGPRLTPTRVSLVALFAAVGWLAGSGISDALIFPQATVYCSGSVCNGTINDDTMYRTSVTDIMDGLDGADVEYGYEGNDTMHGGLGADVRGSAGLGGGPGKR